MRLICKGYSVLSGANFRLQVVAFVDIYGGVGVFGTQPLGIKTLENGNLRGIDPLNRTNLRGDSRELRALNNI